MPKVKQCQECENQGKVCYFEQCQGCKNKQKDQTEKDTGEENKSNNEKLSKLYLTKGDFL